MRDAIIDECIEEAIAAGEAGDRKFFLTLEARRQRDIWLQVRYDYINAAYPYTEEPFKLLQDRGVTVPENVTLETWEPQGFATFDHGAYPQEPIAQFIHDYFTNVLRLSPSSFTLKVIR